jgi:putative transposase
MDETNIKIKGQWMYLYRVIDKEGQTVDFLLTARRDKQAALRFFKKAVEQHGLPDQVSIDKSGANTVDLEALQEETGHAIEIRQSKYLNNLIGQDHRDIKRAHYSTDARLQISSFGQNHFTRHRTDAPDQERPDGFGNNKNLSAVGQFYSLAA